LPVEREDISDNAEVRRLVDYPRMDNRSELIWENVFEFPKEQGESVIWSKYAPTADDVHKVGCEREATKRETKPEMRYSGFIPALVRTIRAIRTIRGHGFQVRHEPDQGDHHAEIIYVPADQLELKKADKLELKFALKGAFGQLVGHSCPEF
jgi:hypothetical protein